MSITTKAEKTRADSETDSETDAGPWYEVYTPEPQTEVPGRPWLSTEPRHQTKTLASADDEYYCLVCGARVTLVVDGRGRWEAGHAKCPHRPSHLPGLRDGACSKTHITPLPESALEGAVDVDDVVDTGDA